MVPSSTRYPTSYETGFGSIVGVTGIGYYNAKDHFLHKQPPFKEFIVYVFEVETISSTWLIYRRYSEIENLSKEIKCWTSSSYEAYRDKNKILVSEFPNKSSYLQQLFMIDLSEDQLRKRYSGLRAWIEELFEQMRMEYDHGKQHDESISFGLDINVFFDFLQLKKNQPPECANGQMPEWAKPFPSPNYVYPTTKPINTIDEVNNERKDDEKAQAESDILSIEIRNQLLQHESHLNALWSCLQNYLQSIHSHCSSAYAVSEEFKRIQKSLGPEEDNNPSEKKKESIDVSSYAEAHRTVLKQYQENLQKLCQDNVIKPLETMSRERFPELKHKYWGVGEMKMEVLENHLIKSLAKDYKDLQMEMRTAISKSVLELARIQINFLENCSNELASSLQPLSVLTTPAKRTSSMNREPLTNSSPKKQALIPCTSAQAEDDSIQNTSKHSKTTSSSTSSSPVHDNEYDEAKGNAWVWGRLPDGKYNSPILRPRRFNILKGQKLIQISCGTQHILYLTENGDVYYYGWGDSQHEKRSQKMNAPHVVQGLALDKALHGRKVVQMACGAEHSIVVTNAGECYSWGIGEDGRLGHGDMRDRTVPRKIMSLLKFRIKQASCGGAHTLVLTDTHKVFSWGRGKNGRLAHGDTRWRDTPHEISNLRNRNISRIVCGWNFSVAISEEGKVYCWGKQCEGQCGIGYTEEDQLVPVLLEHLKDHHIHEVSCGYTHTLALSRDGKIFSWGLGEYGQLGKGCVYQPFPEEVSLSSIFSPSDQIVDVTCGAFHSIATTNRGVLAVWGLNNYGNLGLGHTVNKDTPERLDCFEDGKKIYVSCGDSFTIALEDNVDKDQSSQRRMSWGSTLLSSVVKTTNTEQKYEREEELRRTRKIWRTKILPSWESTKKTHLTHTMWRQGIPPTIRPRVWPLAIGNPLKITPEMYRMYLKRARNQKEHFFQPQEEEEEEENKNLKKKNSAAAIGREFTLGMIHTDLPRTFPSLKLFDESGPYYNHLLELLETYACYRPDLGYIQGMSYLAAMLCLHMSEDRYMAFQCLANLMVSEHLFTFYLMDVALSESYYDIYEDLLSQHSNTLSNHFKNMGIHASMYLMNWLQTLFLQTLPLEIASRVWDCFLLDGTVFLFRTALAIQELFLNELLQGDVDECLPLLQKSTTWEYLWNERIQEEALFSTIAMIQVPSRIYSALDSVVNNVYFYNKSELLRGGYGDSSSVARIKTERKSMYAIGDSLNGVLGGF